MIDYEWDSSESIDSMDEGKYLKKALDVELPEDFDPTKIPQTGEEYLQQVMYEARHCEQLVVASIDTKMIKKSLTFQVGVREECTKAPKGMIPTIEWQESKIEDFSELTQFIRRIKTDSTPTHHHVKTKKWTERISTESPTFSVVMKLEQRSKVDILCIINEQLDLVKAGDTISHQMGIWIYSILSTLELPLIPNEHHNLRELARKCSVIRSNLSENCNEDMYVNLNLFICIVARYFKQLDLAD